MRRPASQYRLLDPKLYADFEPFDPHLAGIFRLVSPDDARPLRVIACAMEGWDHVSVSRQDRCPSWYEMDYAKRIFFEDHEVAIQLHVAIADHVNCHPHCLHLWRKHDFVQPLPPKSFV